MWQARDVKSAVKQMPSWLGWLPSTPGAMLTISVLPFRVQGRAEKAAEAAAAAMATASSRNGPADVVREVSPAHG